MEAKEAVAKAKSYVEELFAEDGIADVRLEEVEYDEGAGDWNVTLGFLRRPEPQSSADDTLANGLAAALQAIATRQRAYRVVRIREGDGAVLSVKQRALVSNAA